MYSKSKHFQSSAFTSFRDCFGSKMLSLCIILNSINVLMMMVTASISSNNLVGGGKVDGGVGAYNLMMIRHQTNGIHGMRAAKITDKFDHDKAMSTANKNRSKNSMIDHHHHHVDHPVYSSSSSSSKIRDQQKGLIILNQIVRESFLKPTFHELWNQRNGRRITFSDIPTLIGKVVRGLTNLTMAIGRTINSENGNGSLSRLITNRLVGVSESLMGWVERSVDDLPSIPRLDAQECMKRSICEAHNQPKKYGAVGLIIQLFFPPYLDAEDANKIVSKYQLAARYGRGDNANCAAQYDDCMVNVLDILQGAINMVF